VVDKKMKIRNVAIFVALDLATLLFVLLILSYYGMSHLMILLLGAVLLMLALYDLQSGLLSAFFADFLGLENPANLGRFKLLPVILAALLLLMSTPVVFEHGWVNETQRWAMQQGGQLIKVALPAVVGGIVVIAIALGTICAGSKKKG
jgi:hypothetical protein